MGDLFLLAGSVLPLIVFLLMIFVGLNMLGYLELSHTLPSSGGAYRLVQSCEEGNWLAFLTGWALILAGLSAGGLILQAFGLAAASLLKATIAISVPPLPLAGGLLALIAIYKMFPNRGKWQIFFLGIPLALLLAGSLAGLPKFQASQITPLQGDWKVTFRLLLISFIGLEVAAGLQGDLVKRAGNRSRLI